MLYIIFLVLSLLLFTAIRFRTILIVLTIVRLLHALQTGLTYDEVYYWNWSRHLDYWFYDQGPGIALSLSASTKLFGNTLLAIKIVPVICNGIFLACGYLLVKQLYTVSTARIWAALIATTPLYIIGGEIGTYDAPLMAAWALSALLAWNALTRKSPILWLAAGLTCSLGVLSKLPMLAFPFGLLLTCLCHRTFRPQLASPWPWIAGLLSLLPIPLMYQWDRTHEHLFTLHSQSLGNRHTSAMIFRWTEDLIGGQLLILGPFLYVILIVALIRYAVQKRSEQSTFVTSLSLPLLIVCLALSLKSKLEVNWPIAAYLTALIPLAVCIDTVRLRQRIAVYSALCFNLALIIVMDNPECIHKITGKTVSKSLGVKLNERFGWDEIETQLRLRLPSTTGNDGVFVAGTNYRTTSMLSWMLKPSTNIECLFQGTRLNQFYLWNTQSLRSGQTAFIVLEAPDLTDIEKIKPFFDSVVELQPPIEIMRTGFENPIKTFHIFQGIQFKPFNIKENHAGY